MFLEDIDFNQIRANGFICMAIVKDGMCLETGIVSEMKNYISNIKRCKIKEQRSYYNIWVIELVKDI